MYLRKRLATRLSFALLGGITAALLLGSFDMPGALGPIEASASSSIAVNDDLEWQADYSDPDKVRKKRKRPASRKRKSRSDMSWVKLHKRFPDTFVLNGPRDKKRVALTFDDAPDDRFTPDILDILAKYDVCATFFVVGERAVKHPELVQRMQREGHMIGNHSYNHGVFSTMTLDAFADQIWKTDAVLRPLIGYSPRFVRPPYGEILPEQVEWGGLHGFITVNWDVDSKDWRNNPGSRKILSNIFSTLQPGSIVLQHAGGGEGQDLSGTVNALPILIEKLRGLGYELVTLPELLGQRQYRPELLSFGTEASNR